MSLNKLLFSFLIVANTMTYGYSMVENIPTLPADNSIITGAKYFIIHTNQKCETYCISKYTTSSGCCQKHVDALNELLQNNTHVLSFFDESQNPIALVSLGKLKNPNKDSLHNSLRIYAQSRLDPDFKPKATHAIIVSASCNEHTVTQIFFFDRNSSPILALPYKGPTVVKEITDQHLAEFRRYLMLDQDLDIKSISMYVQVETRIDTECIIF